MMSTCDNMMKTFQVQHFEYICIFNKSPVILFSVYYRFMFIFFYFREASEPQNFIAHSGSVLSTCDWFVCPIRSLVLCSVYSALRASRRPSREPTAHSMAWCLQSSQRVWTELCLCLQPWRLALSGKSLHSSLKITFLFPFNIVGQTELSNVNVVRSCYVITVQNPQHFQCAFLVKPVSAVHIYIPMVIIIIIRNSKKHSWWSYKISLISLKSQE